MDQVATQIIADVIRRIHQSGQRPLPEGLIPLRSRYQSLFTHAAARCGSEQILFEEAAKAAHDLLSSPTDETALHGDIHHENVLGSERGWLAIDPKGLRGERTFEAANALFNPITLPDVILSKARLEMTAKQMAESLHLDYRRLLLFSFTYGCLSACWTLEDRGDPKLTLAVVRAIRTMI